MDTPVQQHRINYILHFLSYCEKLGVNSEDLLQRSAITSLDDLDAVKMDHLWTKAIDLTGDECLGLHLGEDSNLTALGIVGQLIQSSSTIRNALEHAVQFMGLVTTSFTMELIEDDSSFFLKFNADPECETLYPRSLAQIIDSAVVFSFQEVRTLCLNRIKPKQVTFQNPRPKQTSEYQRIFQCPVVFGAPFTALYFDRAILNEPIVLGNYRLMDKLTEEATAMLEDSRVPGFSKIVVEMLIRQNNMEFPQLGDIASQLSMSERQVQRTLKKEHTSFQQISDQVRSQLSKKLLADPDIRISEVAFMLGYANVTAFSRSFKRWTGSAPRQYQQSQN